MSKLRATPLLLLLAAGCTSKTDLTLSERTVTAVGSAGGSARSADGALTLDFAPGALASDTEITIHTVRDRRVPLLRSVIWELGPSGVQFAAPVTIAARATPPDGESWALAQLDAAFPEPLATSVYDPVAGVVRASLAHFSSYGVVSVFNPCAGLSCGDGCTVCDPADTSCVEPPPVNKACNRSGLCVDASVVSCVPPPDASAPDAPAPDVDPPDVDQPDVDGTDVAMTADAGEDAGSSACSQSFSQNPQPVVDMLLVIDNSCSMAEEQQALGNDFGLLLATLTNNNVDFHLGVTTTDVDLTGAHGTLQGVPTVLSSSTPNLSQLFAANVAVGTFGSAFEQGLEASYLALDPAMLAGPNIGFRRSNASLTVLYLSDEEDQSPQTVDFYADYLLAAADFDVMQANAIVGENPSGCASAAAGARYLALSQRTSGAADSICTPPWNTALTDLGPPGYGYMHRFRLSTPSTGIVSVTVDGVPVSPPEWSYEASTNSILFTAGATPLPGAVIVVDYGC